GDGRLLALKGESAVQELADDEVAVRRAGAISSQVIVLGEDLLPEPTRLVDIQIGPRPVRPTEQAAQNSRATGARRHKRKTSGSTRSVEERRGSQDPGERGRG